MRRFRKPQRFRDPSRLELAIRGLAQTGGWRITRTVILPLLCLYALYSQSWGHDERREEILSTMVSIRYSAEHLPQFMLSELEIAGLPDRIANQARSSLDLSFPVSIFHIDEESMRDRLSKIREIEHFSIDPKGGGKLTINATPATPVAIWKKEDRFVLITASGKQIGAVFDPGEEPDIPVVTGLGADQAAHEIPFLHQVAQPISDKLQGFVRVGERRWDAALKNGLLIMLPAQDPVGALEQAIAWENEHAITSRRISRIDLRLPNHPSFRVIPEEDALLYMASSR